MPMNIQKEFDYIPKQMELIYEKYVYCKVSVHTPVDQQLGLTMVFKRLNQSINQNWLPKWHELICFMRRHDIFCMVFKKYLEYR